MEKRLFVIRKVLWDMHIPPSYLGAHYLAYAELLVLEDQNRLTMVTKWLYPEIAAYYQTSWKAVERDIRTAIAVCWEQDGGAQFRRMTGQKLCQKPSPTGMIETLARHFLKQSEEFWQEEPNFVPPKEMPKLTPDGVHPV